MTSFHPVTAVFPNGLFLDGARADARIDGRVMGAVLRRGYDLATRFELTLFDDDFEILSGGLLSRRGAPRGKLDRGAWARFGQAQIPLDDIMFRLAGIEGGLGQDGHTLSVYVEDEVGTLMRRHKGALKLRRDQDSTRADFIGLMAREVKETRIRYRSPEQGIAQHIKDDKAEIKADKERRRGLSSRDVTIKGVRADREQRRVLEIGLGECDHEQAGERPTLAWLVAVIQESAARNLPGGDADSEGSLQVRRQTAVTIRPPLPGVVDQGSGLAHGGGGGGPVVKEGPSAPARLNPRDVAACARTFLRRGFWGKGGAMKIAAQNPDMAPGEIAQQVQGSAFPTAYSQWEAEAEAILQAYGGVGEIKVARHRYNFKREKKETSWAASGRLADEVRWRRWADRNTLWYVSDEWLYKRHPRFVIQRGKLARLIIVHDGIAHTVLSVSNYSADVGKPVGEITFTCMLNDRWAGAPGAVVELDDLGPLSDKWLIANHELDLFTGVSTITIRRPAPKLPEPAADTETTLLTESAPEKGSPRQRIVAVAQKAFKHPSWFLYAQIRPYPDSLFPPVTSTLAPNIAGPVPVTRTDCSGFATLVYKTAGVPDPNGRGYDGSGNTTTLKANGARTTDPQPGDLAFYGSPEDVKVYIGHGEVIGLGGNPIHRYKVHDRWDFQMFRTYDLGS